MQVGVKRVRLPYKKPLERPYFTASLVSENGAVLEQHDSLPGSYDRGSQMVALDVAVDLTTPVTQIPEREHCPPLDKWSCLFHGGSSHCAWSDASVAVPVRSSKRSPSPQIPSREWSLVPVQDALSSSTKLNSRRTEHQHQLGIG